LHFRAGEEVAIMALAPSVAARRTLALALALGAGSLLLASAPAVAGTPELTLQAGSSSAPDAGGESSDLRWALLRMSWGDRLQLRGEIPWLDFEGGGLGASPPGLGPVTPRRPGQGPQGNGSGGSAAGGDGSTVGALEEPAVVATGSQRTRGFGDLRVAASYRLAGGGSRLFRIDAGASAKLPTADEEKGLGTGETDWRVGVSGEYRFWSLTTFGGVGYNSLGDPAGIRYEDVFDAYAGIESLPLAERFLISGWLEGHPEVLAGEGARVAAAAGLRTLGSVRFELQARAGLTDAAEGFAISASVSFGLRPPVAGPTGVRR